VTASAASSRLVLGAAGGVEGELAALLERRGLALRLAELLIRGLVLEREPIARLDQLTA